MPRQPTGLGGPSVHTQQDPLGARAPLPCAGLGRGRALALAARGSSPCKTLACVPGDAQCREQARGAIPPCSAQRRDRGDDMPPLAEVRLSSSQVLAPPRPQEVQPPGSGSGLLPGQRDVCRTRSPDPQREPGQQGRRGMWPGWHRLWGAARAMKTGWELLLAIMLDRPMVLLCLLTLPFLPPAQVAPLPAGLPGPDFC